MRTHRGQRTISRTWRQRARFSGVNGDVKGASAIEFTLMAPLYILLIVAAVEGVLLMWTHLSLQHGTEMAAQCASNDIINCGDTDSIKTYAAHQTYGLNPPPSVFSVDLPKCGNRVSATYSYRFLTSHFGVPPLNLSAQFCVPG